MNPQDNLDNWLKELVQALDKAERRQGVGSVALEWFREVFLPGEGYDWAGSPHDVDAAIKAASGNGVITIAKKSDSESSANRVTVIKLERSNKAVTDILRELITDAFNFQPVEIRGEPLSDTVLRERR